MQKFQLVERKYGKSCHIKDVAFELAYSDDSCLEDDDIDLNHINLRSPNKDLHYLIDSNEIIIDQSNIIIMYELDQNFECHYFNSGGFTRMKLVRMIIETFKHLPKEENEDDSVNYYVKNYSQYFTNLYPKNDPYRQLTEFLEENVICFPIDDPLYLHGANIFELDGDIIVFLGLNNLVQY